MAKEKVNQRVCSILVIVFLVCSGVILILPSTPMSDNARAMSTWTLTSDSDFGNGVLNNITIAGNGEGAELRLNQGIWVKKLPQNKPSARELHAMVTVYGTDQIVLFSGQDINVLNNDTWAYNTTDNTWTKKDPSIRPNARYRHGMASIFGDDKVLLFSGNNFSSMEEMNRTWVYDLSEDIWIDKSPINHPTWRDEHAMCPIYGTDLVLLFGGLNWSGSSGLLNDTWIYNSTDNTWKYMNCHLFIMMTKWYSSGVMVVIVLILMILGYMT